MNIKYFPTVNSQYYYHEMESIEPVVVESFREGLCPAVDFFREVWTWNTYLVSSHPYSHIFSIYRNLYKSLCVYITAWQNTLNISIYCF